MNDEIITKAEFARRTGTVRSYITKLGKEGRLVYAPDGKKIYYRQSRDRVRITGSPSDAFRSKFAASEMREAQNRMMSETVKSIRLSAVIHEIEKLKDEALTALIEFDESKITLSEYQGKIRKTFKRCVDALADNFHFDPAEWADEDLENK